jgi:hypothetical protein
VHALLLALAAALARSRSAGCHAAVVFKYVSGAVGYTGKALGAAVAPGYSGRSVLLSCD